jgi:hypothetical protein
MTEWKIDELEKIGRADELRLASQRRDGTLRRSVIIWVVRVDDQLYVRCVNGRQGAWFRGVLTQHAGKVSAGGADKEVVFIEETDPGINDQIDAAYLSKYSRYPQYVAPMVTPKVREATLKLVPR